MKSTQTITGLLLVIWGGVAVARPDLLLRWKSWFSQKFYGAQFKPSAKTVMVQRLLGALLFLLGLIVMIGIVN